MKKVLSFVLVLAMILGSVSLAFATEFTDTKGTDYDEAARLLSDLGVISGKTSTTFAPNDNVTRAEFVAMVVRALGFGQQPNAVTPFTEDVPASYWASGYIKVASELGITFGKSATRFAPKDNITNDEMIAMVIRALGYKVEYLQGSFPSAQINQALQLDILEGIPTGSTTAIRGDVAQLIFNALGQAVVSYDGNGNIIPGGTTLAQRCGAVARGYKVIDGTEASAINLKPYVGAYASYYTGKPGTASAGKVIAVGDVVTEFITVTYSDEDGSLAPAGTGLFEAITAGDLFGDYKIKKDSGALAPGATSEPASDPVFIDFVNFDNGTNTGDRTTGAKLVDGATYTMAVTLSGNYISKIYSANLWTVDQSAKVTAEDLEELEKDKLLGLKFALNNKDVRDDNSYEILGVDKPEDIKKDNVVAVYLNRVAPAADRRIVRIEVGTETMSGTVSVINSARGTYTIGGETKKISTLGSQNVKQNIAASDVKAGDKGTFYLDYQGRLHSFVKEDSTHLYGIVLDENFGAPGLNGATPKVKLYTEEGKKVTYVCIDDLVNYDVDNNGVYGGVADTAWVPAGLTAGDIVDFTLNANGQVRSLDIVVANGAAATPGTKITKSGTLGGNVITNTSVLFGFDGTNYSVIKRADVLEKTPATYKQSSTNNVIDVALLTNVAGTETPFYVFQKWEYVDNDYGYRVTFITDDGETAQFYTNEKDTTAAPNTKAAQPGQNGTANAYAIGTDIFQLKINTSNVIDPTSVKNPAAILANAPLAYGLLAQETTCKKQGDAYVLDNGTNTWTLASDATVLVREGTGTWSVGSVSDLRNLDNTAGNAVAGYDLTTGGDGVYDLVFVTLP